MPDANWIDVLQKVSGVSFATFLLYLGYAGWKQIWVWGWQLTASQAREEKANERADYWQNLYLSRVVPLEKTVEKISAGGQV